jgi:NADPH2:quinone reductase
MSETRLIVRRTGGPEVIETETFDPGPVPAGQVRVRHRAVGLNFIDVYRRNGLYAVDLPAFTGTEAAGVIEAVGDGVTGLKAGDRVGYATGPLGACATVRDIDPELLIPLPDGVSEEVAAASLLKGMTAAFLIEQCARVQAGQTVLVHAAAGGVGSILVQWLSARGVRVIAHAGSPEKAARAKADGADLALSLPFDQLAAAVREATDGRGVDVAFDGVGAASWSASLASVARRGLLVTYGNASGPVPPFSPLELSKAGSIFVTRPTLFDYATTREERLDLAGLLFDRILAGDVRIAIDQRFALTDAAEAHRALEARRTTGSTILTV